MIKSYRQFMLNEDATPSDENINDKIIALLKKDKTIKDNSIHALAERIGISAHILENHVYKLFQSFWSEGKSKDFTGEYDEEQVKMGMKVEMEHTTSPLIAHKIVTDHLAEKKDYYSYLDKMEQSWKKD